MEKASKSVQRATYRTFDGNAQGDSGVPEAEKTPQTGEKTMNFLEPVPAIRRIETDRSDLFAIDVVGHASAADAENLFGLLEAAYMLHPKIDVLVRLVDHQGVDWADLSRQTLERGKTDALEHVGRCATIGEPNWIGQVQGLFTSLPTELRHFDADHEPQAWQWLGAKPVEAA
jgi:hypothetical protein